MIEETKELLNWRYACKKFDAKQKISSEEYEVLMSSLHLAPSSFGMQPWRFLDIQNESIKAELKDVSWGQEQVVDASHFIVLAVETEINEVSVDRWMERMAEVNGQEVESLNGFKDVLSGFLAKMSDSDKVEWAKRQAYIALGALMHTAAGLKIDTCPMEGIDPAEYDRILDLPAQKLTSAVACAVGYRSPEDKYQHAPKVRFPYDEIVRVY